MTRPEKDEHRPADSSAGVDQRRRRKGRWLLSLMLLVFLVMAAFTVRWWQYRHRSHARDTGYKARSSRQFSTHESRRNECESPAPAPTGEAISVSKIAISATHLYADTNQGAS